MLADMAEGTAPRSDAAALMDPLCPEPLHARILEVLERAEVAATRPRCVPDIRSGFSALDQQLTGRRLVVMFGRPQGGKTALALCMARETARVGHVLYCSSLGESVELARRLLAAEAKIPVDRFTEGRLSSEDWAHATESAVRLGSTPLWLLDARGESVSQIRAAAMALKNTRGLDLLVVDGVRDRSDDVVPALEELAFRLNCSVLAVYESDLAWDPHLEPYSGFAHTPVLRVRDDRESPPLEVSELQRWLRVTLERSGSVATVVRACLDKRFALVSAEP